MAFRLPGTTLFVPKMKPTSASRLLREKIVLLVEANAMSKHGGIHGLWVPRDSQLKSASCLCHTTINRVLTSQEVQPTNNKACLKLQPVVKNDTIFE